MPNAGTSVPSSGFSVQVREVGGICLALDESQDAIGVTCRVNHARKLH